MLVYTRRHGHEAEGWYDSTDIDIGSARRLPDPIDHASENLLGKVDFVLNDAHRLGFVYERSRVENQVENLSRVAPPGYLQRIGDDSNQRDRFGLHYDWLANRQWFDNLSLQIDHQDSNSHGITRILTGSGQSTTPTTGNTTPCTLEQPCHRAEDRSTDQQLNRIALTLDKQIIGRSSSHDLSYGLALQRRQIDFSAIDFRWNSAGVLDSATIDPAQVPETDADSWNLFFLDRIHFADGRWQLSVGARYDHYEYSPKLSDTYQDDTGSVGDVSFASPSGQIGLSHHFLPEHEVWLQAGRGFRAPSTGELYAMTDTTDITEVGSGNVVSVPTYAANPELEAETSRNLEVGYRWETDQIRIGVSWFNDRYSNFIESVRETINPDIEYQTCSRGQCQTHFGYDVSSLANVGEVTVNGFEFQGMWRFGDDWQLRAAWSHANGEQKNGSPLDSINPDRGVLGLSWQSPNRKLQLSSILSHARAKAIQDVNPSLDVFGQPVMPFLSDSYSVLDLFGSFDINANLRLQAGLYNVFDQEHYQWARIRNVTRGDFYLYGYATDEGIGRFSEPGRNVRVSLSLSF